jgi:hypothetical protein
VYLQQGEYDKALDLYRSSGMTGATAADYRAAAGIALQAQRNVVAEKFLWEGRQRWPDDPELLHMTALRALSHNDYEGTEHYLVAALAAARQRGDEGRSNVVRHESNRKPSRRRCRRRTSARRASLARCRAGPISQGFGRPRRFRPFSRRDVEAIERLERSVAGQRPAHSKRA